MYHIPDVDIGARYAFTSAVMSEHLQAIILGNLSTGREIPKGVLSAAKNLFGITLRQLEHDRDPQNIPVPRMSALTVEKLVMDMLEPATGKPYSQHYNFDEFERDVRQCSELLHELPDKIRYDRSQYEILRKFFSILNQKANSWMYDHAMCGTQSPYIAPLGS